MMSLSDMFFFDLLLCTTQDSCDIKIRNYSKNGGPRIYAKGENLRKGVARSHKHALTLAGIIKVTRDTNRKGRSYESVRETSCRPENM